MVPPSPVPSVPEVEETKPDPVVEKVTEKVDAVPSSTAKPAEDPSLNEVDQGDKKVSGIDSGLIADEAQPTVITDNKP